MMTKNGKAKCEPNSHVWKRRRPLSLQIINGIWSNKLYGLIGLNMVKGKMKAKNFKMEGFQKWGENSQLMCPQAKIDFQFSTTTVKS